MFDKLNEVKEIWKGGEPVTVHDFNDDDIYYAIPIQAVTTRSLQKYAEAGIFNLNLVLSQRIRKELAIPTLSTLYAGLASRYPLLYLLNQNHPVADIATSISIGPRKQSYSWQNLAEFLQDLGDLIENRVQGSIEKDKFIKDLTDLVTSPGPINLVFSNHDLLIRSHRIENITASLSVIAKYPISTMFGKIMLSETTSVDTEISSKTIINLWRSIEKIDKETITYL